jgi:hypothetical protein
MKAKKALKRLRRVEELLSVVIDEFVANELSVRKLLHAAKQSVIRAKAGISPQPVPLTAKKPPAKAKRKRSNLGAEGRRKKMSLSSKERPTVAKRTSRVGPSVKTREEKDTTKSRLAAAPMTKPAGPPALEGSQENRHAN